MQFFRFLIRGEKFPGDLIGERRLVGFYATRFVQALDLQAAKRLALESLHKEDALQSKSDQTSEAKVYFEEVVEVSADDAALASGGVGITFITMK